jgi:hypothetical protein
MAANPIPHADGGSFLLELLYFAGWQLKVRNGETTTIRARRADVEVEVTGASPEEAAGIAFARAMRSGDRDEPPEDD